MKAVAFNGSPRADGNTFLLLNCVLEEIKRSGIETELVQVGKCNVHGCRACYQCFKQADRRCACADDCVNEWIEKMLAADAILLGSPTYFADITSEMKALIDRAGMTARANGAMFSRKVGAAVVTVRRGGAIHAFDSLNHFFLISDMIVPGSSYWNLAFGREKGQAAKDEEGMRTMQTLGRNIAWLLKKIA
ncbi:MAG: flavodoxin family protein [Kiritimatiellae bacterium]|nr:flavodoxin family protein [Kiritimatiellia bacterium]